MENGKISTDVSKRNMINSKLDIMKKTHTTNCTYHSVNSSFIILMFLRLQVKINKLESDISHMERDMGKEHDNSRYRLSNLFVSLAGVTKAMSSANREERESISSLNDKISKQKSKIHSLTEQIKKLNDDLVKKNRQIALTKQTAYLHKPSGSRKENTVNNVSEIDIVPAPNPMQSSFAARMHDTKETFNDSNLIDVARNYKLRCVQYWQWLAA